MKNEIILFENKEQCCGCGACVSVCPKKAISMQEDSCGFKYPRIDDALCVGCGACKKVCSYQNEAECNHPMKGYVAVNTNKKQVNGSASGGVFAAVAEKVLKAGGKVYGAAYSFDKQVTVNTIGIDQLEDLPKLQGSKYVQSNTENIFDDVKKAVLEGRRVLFSGTPCQVAALNKFLGRKYENILTVDIVCHGVPNQRFFNDYLDTLKKDSNDISEFNFRDKNRGWEDYFIRFNTKSSRKCKDIHCRISSFYEYFLKSYVCRENCYSCKFASLDRPADLTIGDYWGIAKQHPELFKEDKWFERKYTGISCLLVNTEKGEQAIEACKEQLELVPSTVDKIAAGNGQLRQPTHRSEKREYIFELYRSKGYAAVENDFQKSLTLSYRIKDSLKCMIPLKIKMKIKRVRHH